MTKISIIIPVYNLEEYIQKTFNSVLNQTIGFENLEVIFVDDYSTDNSKNIIDKWAKEYDNVISIHLDSNSGYAGKPRNIGLEKSNSEYILFLDGDDCLVEDACEKLYNISKNTKSDITIAGYNNNYPDGKKRIINIKGLKQDIEICKNPKKELKLMNNPPAPATKLFKKELLTKNNIKFPEDIQGEDLVFVYTTYFNAEIITFIKDYYVLNRTIRDRNDKSISNTFTLKNMTNLIKAYKLVLNLFEKYEINEYMITVAICVHFNYFLRKVNKLTEEDKKNVLKSNEFNEFKKSNFFKNNILFEVLFNNLENEIYDNANFIKEIKKIKVNEKKIQDLKKQNKKLKKINMKKDKKLKEIKSSKSWKITKPLRKVSKVRTKK